MELGQGPLGYPSEQVHGPKLPSVRERDGYPSVREKLPSVWERGKREKLGVKVRQATPQNRNAAPRVRN